VNKNPITPKDEPEVRRAKGKRYVASCNAAVYDASWGEGDWSARGGLQHALKLAEQAYRAHNLPFARGLSEMRLYDPRRFTWLYDPAGNAEHCVKVRDNYTGRIAVWPHF